MSTESLDDTLYEMDNDIAEQEVAVVFDEATIEQIPTLLQAPPPPSLLTGLSLDLSVRCGAVSLSLEALQQLAPGSVLGVNGIAPGEATLCHGERVVAHGELVDVDGRLGLQVTRVVFDR